MKQIANKTQLKCGDKTYQPVNVDGVVYWIDEEATTCRFYLHKSFGEGHQIYDVENDGGGLKDFKMGQPIRWCSKIVAQSQPKLEGIPVIDLMYYHWNLALKASALSKSKNKSAFRSGFVKGYKSNPNQYTQKDIEKAIELASKPQKIKINGIIREHLTKEEIFEQINSISVIEVDEQFNIINYE